MRPMRRDSIDNVIGLVDCLQYWQDKREGRTVKWDDVEISADNYNRLYMFFDELDSLKDWVYFRTLLQKPHIPVQWLDRFLDA